MDADLHLAPLPDPWSERRPGDHDWSGPGLACNICRVDLFAVTGPCTPTR